MRTRFLFAAAAAAALTLAACGDSSTSPRLSPAEASKDDITCRSGYHIATRDDGSQGCETDETFSSAAPTAAPAASAP
jgi:hypothetical protein